MQVIVSEQFQMVKFIEKKDKYDIFADFLLKETDRFAGMAKHNDKTLKECCKNLQDIIKGILNDTSDNPIEETIAQQFKLEMAEPEQKLAQLTQQVKERTAECEKLELI